MAHLLDLWQQLYDVVLIHITILVADPTYCPHLVIMAVTTSCLQLHHVDIFDSLVTETRIFNFDLYHNSVAVSLSFMLSKISNSKGQRSEVRSLCIQKLLTLLSWQLRMFHEEASMASTACCCFFYFLFLFVDYLLSY